MNPLDTCPPRADAVPLPENIRSVQPGGGRCYQIELAWGRWRRWLLKTFRPGYVAAMEQLRKGDTTGSPHPILDPRDLKYCRNLCTAHWAPEHDRFAWRERLPLARWGLAEAQLMGWPLSAATIGLGMLPGWLRLLAIVPAVLLGLVIYFFRDPRRTIPGDESLLVSPADGKVVEIAELEHDPFIGGRAVRIGVFLSIFNVHINRAPLKSRVVELRYHPGEFSNAMNPASAERNESMWIGLEADAPPYRRMVVRQISGLIARRIVCSLRPGETLDRGQRFGMIKLGSRTELILPAEGLQLKVQLGQKIQAGSTPIGRFENGSS